MTRAASTKDHRGSCEALGKREIYVGLKILKHLYCRLNLNIRCLNLHEKVFLFTLCFFSVPFLNRNVGCWRLLSFSGIIK